MKSFIALSLLGVFLFSSCPVYAEEEELIQSEEVVEELVAEVEPVKVEQPQIQQSYSKMNARERAKARKNRKKSKKGFSPMGDKKNLPAFSEQEGSAVVADSLSIAREDSEINKNGQRVKKNKRKYQKNKKGKRTSEGLNPTPVENLEE